MTHLAVDQQVAASTQNPCTERTRSEALSALLFLYREVLRADVELPIHALRCAPNDRNAWPPC